MNKEKNVYLITFKECGWDEFEGFVVVADTKKEALQFANVREIKPIADNRYLENTIIQKIGISYKKKGIYLESFNAG